MSPASTMNGRRRPSSGRGESSKLEFVVQPKTFIFFDKITGTQRFEVAANRDGSLPSDYAESLLAVQCLVRGKLPRDFMIMIAPTQNLIEGLDHRAMRLVRAGQHVNLSDATLTCRQKQVLRAILQSFSNKEIGTKLNVTERTVKFHVSTLLTKFGVTGRVELMRKVTDLLASGRIFIGIEAPPVPAPSLAAPALAAPALAAQTLAAINLRGPEFSREGHVYLVPLKRASRV